MCDKPQGALHLGILRIDLSCLACPNSCQAQGLVKWARRIRHSRFAICGGQTAVGSYKRLVLCDRAMKELYCSLIVGSIVLCQMPKTALIHLPRTEALRRL